jgi:Fanconi anemia group M protein
MAIDGRWYGIGKGAQMMNLDGIEFREYQANILKSILASGNTLVVLPTGLGKTIIGAGVVADAASNGLRSAFLAPTKPLAEQHYNSLRRLLGLPEDELLLLTGSMQKGARALLEGKAKVIIATPQTFANDLKAGSISLDSFGAVVFDECHRAVGKYAYTYIANECDVRGVLMVGLTASPGGKKEKINALVKTLAIRHIEARISTDGDVAKYVMPNRVHVVNVDLSPRIREIAGLLKPEINESLDGLHKLGLFHFRNFETIPKGRLIELGNQIDRMASQSYKFAAMFSYSKLLNLTHAYDLLVVEGIYPFSKYIDSLYAREKKSRSLEHLLKSQRVVAARASAHEALKNGEEHPKVLSVLDIIKDYRNTSSIVFAQYRSTVKMLVEYLNNNGIPAAPFIGKKEGFTQDAQKRTIEDFRNGKFRVLVASSIGEEGIDIPGVDLVLFYEAIPNEIRNIQRRGRTGRFGSGEIYLLLAKDTKDQIYFYISRQRELKMLSILRDINGKISAVTRRSGSSQSTL